MPLNAEITFTFKGKGKCHLNDKIGFPRVPESYSPH